MMWVAIFVGIVLFAVAQTVVLVWWLWRKGRALVAELGVLAERADELADLVSRVQVPDTAAFPERHLGVERQD